MIDLILSKEIHIVIITIGERMTIEQNIFKHTKIDLAKLAAQGFIQSDKGWVCEKTFMNGDFKALITIDKQNNLSGEVYEVATKDIFLPLRVETMGGFANDVREAYIKILEDIRDRCCQVELFTYAQANRLTSYIFEKYGDNPCFPWNTFSGYGVFKNSENGKWYALIMNMDYSKLDKNKSGEIEVVNIKLSEEKIPVLRKQKGFYPAYHMNKKSWITIVLNDTIEDKVLFNLLDESHNFTVRVHAKNKNGKTVWLIPANPQYFDIEAAFANKGEIIWKQSRGIRTGDIAYMYVATPISAILYKCEVTEVNIPYEYADNNVKMTHVMKIKMLKQYNKDFMPFARLKNFGVKTVRGPRACPPELVKILDA